jgi:ketosteroid isomerase-like protein
MSQENVELIVHAFRQFEAEDFDLEERWHEDSRVTAPEGWPEPGPFEGREAIAAQFRRLAADVEEHRFTHEELVADRDDWVVISFIWEVRGAGSGAAVASKMAGAYRVTDGKIKDAHFRWTAEDALKAAGIEE